MNRKATSEFSQASDRMVSNLAGFVAGAEDLLKATKHVSGEGLAAARARLEEQLDAVREAMDDAQDYAREQTKKAALGTDRWVHRNPWQAIGIAMAVGIVLGFLSQRR